MSNVYKKFFRRKIIKETILFIFHYLLILIMLFSNSVEVRAHISNPIISQINIEKKLAYKYCQSKDKKLFEGLNEEFILKYEYFFSSISKNSLKNIDKLLQNFISQVDQLCSYKLTKSEIIEFNNYFEKFYTD